ncbi:MAG TPA: FG-GAP-like repeat-containing protein [Tepidisphaeraceae bacterium]
MTLSPAKPSPRLIATLIAALLFGCKRPTPTPATSPSRPAPAGIVAANNRGVGLMGRFEFDSARQKFADLLARYDDPDVAANLAIATLNRQQPGDSEEAMRILDQVLATHPNHVRALYCKALLLLNAGRAADALGAFQAVADADAADAYPRYYVGQCLLAAGRRDQALAAFRKAIEIDPNLRSAHYGAFLCLQQINRQADAKAELDEFQHLKDNPQARLVEFKYTRMGPKAEVKTIDDGAPVGPAAPPAGPIFADPVPLPILNATNLPWRREAASGDTVHPSITAADIDGDGRVDLFIAGAFDQSAPARNAVLLRRDNGFEIALDHPLAKIDNVNAGLWGDFDNDGLTDVYFCRRGPNQLWRQTARGQWQDVTEATHTAGGDFDTIDGAFVDADHDGDLDLILVCRNGPTELLNNNLDGTFRPIGQQAGIAGDGREATGLVVADLDHDGDADLVILKKAPPNDIFLNDRLWKYRKPTGFDQLAASPITAAVAADTDADGQVELHTALPTGLSRWTPDRTGRWRAQSLAPVPAVASLAVADVTGTGALALMHTSDRTTGILPVSTSRPLFTTNVATRAIVLANLDPTSGPSIVAISADGLPLIWRPGPGRYPFAALSLSGKRNRADQTRCNASGIGVTLAGRVGARWTALSTYRNTSGPGQTLSPVSLGLGGASRADFVSLTWPDGLRQTELDVPADALTKISETQRQTSSCPVLFAWDGHAWSFVTDCLGVGGIGFAVGPNQYAPERPWENLLLDSNRLKPLNGELRLKLTEPMEEACYLDAVSLTAYALPPGWSMALDERMGINDPQPTGQPRFYRRLIVTTSATDDRGRDVTTELARIDGQPVDPGERDARFVGFCREYAITMRFDHPIDAAPGDPMLLIDGWIEYPYSQTMFAAWQAGVAYQAPTLEARAADGRWVKVLDQFGYPAGMPRQMSIPIPRDQLPAGTRELRLRTNQEIYWDRIAIAWAEPCPQARPIAAPLARATLVESGFPLRQALGHHRPAYDYSRRAPLWDVAHQDGFYTAFGPVEALLRSTDDALAIFGPGEEVDLAFTVPEAPAPSGFTRHWVLSLSGWCKDRDLYTKDGDTLEPLPHRSAATADDLRRRDELHRRFNTRYRSGGGWR